MTGSGVCKPKEIGDLFTDSQVQHILKQALPPGDQGHRVVRCDIEPAADGLTGFLGEHFKVVLHTGVGETARPLHLFVKRMPQRNLAKAAFIEEANFFKREKLTFEVFEDLGGDEGPHPWRTVAYFCSDTMLVMPDLCTLGYSQRHCLYTFDLAHALTVVSSVARFHALFANHVTSKVRLRNYNFLEEHMHVMDDTTFCDSPWLRVCGKVSANLLDIFSEKYSRRSTPNLEEKLSNLFVAACDDLKDYKGTLNVLIHRDLWVNNILFKYDSDNNPINAIILDFQCLRYGPPAFDIMIFLYLTTSRSFRDVHEREIFAKYFSVFTESVDEETKLRLKEMSYSFEEFLSWCEKSRRFAIFEAIGIFPYILMEPKAAARWFDNPDTFHKYNFEDRTEPVIEYARQCSEYKTRQLDVIEEFIERFVLTN